jgi:hypothetical protein
VIGGKVLVVHGGVAEGTTLDDLRTLDRFQETVVSIVKHIVNHMVNHIVNHIVKHTVKHIVKHTIRTYWLYTA